MDVTVKKGKQTAVEQQVITTLVTRPVILETQDIKHWRDAVNSARNKRLNQLYRLYENITTDGVFDDAIDKRVSAITNSDILFVDDQGAPVQRIMDMIDTQQFESLLSEIILAKAWGVSVIDIMSLDPLRIYSVPRRNINHFKKIILPDEMDYENGVSYADVPYIFEARANDFGFIYKAAPFVLYKRGGFGDYAQFVEIFGQPIRVGKYATGDKETKTALDTAMKTAGSALYLTIPKEADIEMIQNSTNSNGELHDKFLKSCDEQILITVLGQTMTTKDGSSRSQSETHMEVLEAKHAADRRFVTRILNSSVTPLIVSQMGIKGKFVFPEKNEQLTTETKVKIALDIRGEGIPVDDDYIYKISGVEKPKGSTPAPAPKQRRSQQPPVEDAYHFSWLRSFFAEALGRRAPLRF